MIYRLLDLVAKRLRIWVAKHGGDPLMGSCPMSANGIHCADWFETSLHKCCYCRQ